MSKTKSLNYLLLDELQKRKSKTNKKEIDEIQQKLKIIMKDNIYNIEWVFQKKNYILKLKTSDFIFYKKNDSENKVFEKTLDLNNASAA